ncbi:DUF6629 family protein [Legionella cincinnatiensis]|uniref:Uncharacterized protein n=1 Tax=Legionella cincinnatiensis TaxID=28085 RepID=A0A378IES1_9GAMM|nr:DUF6629 family protein [Legionella cincinnatiensis]KTC92163.1 hypothetical protein Lcin_0942 [Legionella cincinnatiensis]STX33533.1 Uncharacterised protein [Legionella cincinnatiensis]
MCFSASASFTAAGIISAVGICSLLKARTYPLCLFALTPLFFAVQQALEGIVWITLMQGDSISLLNKIGVYGFLFFAGAFWPLWLSGCLYLLEEDKKRKKLLLMVFITGIIAASKILFRLVAHKHTAVISDHHINYPMFALTYSVSSMKHIFYSYALDLVLTGAYLIAVIVPFFISSIRGMWIIGAITTIGFIVAAVFYALAFGSVWCFFGALSTIATYYIVANYTKMHVSD